MCKFEMILPFHIFELTQSKFPLLAPSCIAAFRTWWIAGRHSVWYFRCVPCFLNRVSTRHEIALLVLWYNCASSTVLPCVMLFLILDQETGIILQLQNVVLRHSSLLLDVMHFTAQLDWWVSVYVVPAAAELVIRCTQTHMDVNISGNLYTNL